MFRRSLIVSAATIVIAASPALAKDTIVSIQNGTVTAKQVTGPATVVFYGINPLRFTASVSQSSTWSAAPAAPNLSALVSGGTPADYKADLTAAVEAVAPAQDAVDRVLRSRNPASQSDIDAVATSINADASVRAARELFSRVVRDEAKLEPQESGLSDSDRALLADMRGLLGTYRPLTEPAFAASDLYAKADEDCSGLRGGSLVDTVTLTKSKIPPPKLTSVPSQVPASAGDDTQTSTATVNCLGSIAVTSGYIFSTIPQNSYTAVATNPQAPHGSASPPPATVQQSSTNLSESATFVHVAPWICGETCVFLTFGATVKTGGSASNSNSINFALGTTLSIYRYAYLTLGANLGQVSTPASGYGPGQPVAAGAKIPTVSNGRTGFFVGISFGGSPGGTSTTSKSANQASSNKGK